MPASKPPNNTALIWTLLGLFILAGPSENQLGSQQQAHSQDPPPAPVVEEDDLLEDDLLDDDLLDDDLLDDDLLADEKPSPENPSENTPAHQGSDDNSLEAHALLLAENEFPPAHRCASCHPKQYREWSVSQHAYSQLSPLMLSMQIALNKGTSSTTGDFCVRCHTPVGSDIGEPSSLSNIERHPCGINRATIYRWRKDGWGIDELFDDAAGGWDPAEVTAWSKDMKRARRKILRPAFDVDEDSLGDGEDTRDWGTVYRKAKAVLATLQARRLQDSLVDRSTMEEQFSMRIAEITTALDSLAAQLAPRLAPLTRESEIQAVLREAFHQLRDHFAREDE